MTNIEIGRSRDSCQALQHIHDLIALLGPRVATGSPADRRSLRAARLRMIKADIDARLDQCHLTLHALATRHALSPRYIRHLFETDGTSLTEFVMQQRLARAHRLLTDQEHAGRTIRAIARQSGFRDISHFNHCFRRRFGMTPSNARLAGAANPAAAHD